MDAPPGTGRLEVFASRAGPAAYRVERTADGVVETVLPVRVRR